MEPKRPHSAVLSAEEEATVVAFHRHTLLLIDDCLYALQPTIPHLTRSSLHRCLQRQGISRLPEVTSDKPPRKASRDYPVGYVHINFAEVRTEEGKLYLFVAIDGTRPAEAGGEGPLRRVARAGEAGHGGRLPFGPSSRRSRTRSTRC